MGLSGKYERFLDVDTVVTTPPILGKGKVAQEKVGTPKSSAGVSDSLNNYLQESRGYRLFYSRDKSLHWFLFLTDANI